MLIPTFEALFAEALRRDLAVQTLDLEADAEGLALALALSVLPAALDDEEARNGRHRE